MKNYIYLLVFLVAIYSCCNDNDVCHNQNNDENFCGGQNLGIDELARFSTVVYINNIFFPSESPRWEWRTYNDTIEVGGIIKTFGLPDSTRHIFFKKNGNCINYLSSRDVYFDDGGVILDPITNEVIQSGYNWHNYYDLQFKLQKYKIDKILIGEVSVDGISGTKFWMEFTSDVHRPIPWEYEQYYHN